MDICNDCTKLKSNILLFVLHNAQAPVHGLIHVCKRCSLTFLLSHSIAAAGDSAMLATIDDFPPRGL